MNAPAARSLYRQLWRKTRELPTRDLQAFYRGSIRSGFVSFSDEDDPETLERIRGQALKDADWIVNKYKGQQAPQRRK